VYADRGEQPTETWFFPSGRCDLQHGPCRRPKDLDRVSEFKPLGPFPYWLIRDRTAEALSAHKVAGRRDRRPQMVNAARCDVHIRCQLPRHPREREVGDDCPSATFLLYSISPAGGL